MIYSSVYTTQQLFYALPFVKRIESFRIGDYEFSISMYKDLDKDKIEFFARPIGKMIELVFHLEEYDENDITGSLIKAIEKYFYSVRFFTELLKSIEIAEQVATRVGYGTCQAELRSILGIQED